MRRTILPLAMALGLSLGVTALSSSQSWAACNQPNLKGTFQVYAIGTSGDDASTVSCTLIVKQNGRVGGSSSCKETLLSDGQTETYAVQSGQLNVAKSCKLSGFIRYDGCRQSITDGWVSGNKKSFEGIGESCDGGLFKFSGVRR